MKRGLKNQAGFTLLELLLSLSLFAIISVAVYSALASGVQVWRRAQEVSSTYQTTRLILEKVAGDLRSAVMITGSPFIGEPQRLSFLIVRRGPARLPAARLSDGQGQAGPAGGPAVSEIRRITYELKEEEASEHFALFRLDESYVEGLQEDHREPDYMAGPITELAFQYAFPGEDEAIPWEWRGVWEESGKIPVGVKMTLTLSGRHGEERQFTKTVFMPQGLQEKER